MYIASCSVFRCVLTISRCFSAVERWRSLVRGLPMETCGAFAAGHYYCFAAAAIQPVLIPSGNLVLYAAVYDVRCRSHPSPGAVFPAGLPDNQEEGAHPERHVFGKHLGEMLPMPTFLAPTAVFQLLWRYRPWEIVPGGEYTVVHGYISDLVVGTRIA